MTNTGVPGRTPDRILIIKPSSLGDIVHALPVLAACRQHYPQAHIAWLVANPFRSLLDGHPFLDEVIPFDRKQYGRFWRDRHVAGEFWRFLRGLRTRRFDLVLDFQGLFRSGFFAWVTGARRRVGFAHARELAWLFYHPAVRVPTSLEHAVDKNVHLARAAGLPLATPEFALGLRDDELRAIRTRLTAADPATADRYVALVPGTRWPTKTWRPDRLAALIDGIAETTGVRTVLLGSPADRDLTDQICRAVHVPVVDLVGQTTLRELSAALAGAALVVSHDSGPMHLAAALERPLVAIFGPTNPRRTGPYATNVRVVQQDLPCVPCYRRQCPLGHHACLHDLPVAAVLHHVRELLPVTSGGAGVAHGCAHEHP